MAITKVVTTMDSLTIDYIDKANKAISDRIALFSPNAHGRKVTPESKQKNAPAIVAKLNKMKAKYDKQKAKTLALYQKNKKKDYLKGVNKSMLSVKKIYELAGKNTKSYDSNFANKFLEHPIENSMLSVSGALAIGSIMSVHGAVIGEAVKTAAIEVFKVFAGKYGAAAALGAWSVALAAGPIISKIVRKNREMHALEKQNIEDAIYKETAYNLDNLATPVYGEKKEMLITQAVEDPEIRAHLEAVAKSTTNNPNVRQHALMVLVEAKKRLNKTKLQNVEMDLTYEFSKKEEFREMLEELEEMKTLDIARKERLVEKSKKPTMKITNTGTKTQFDSLISTIEAATKATVTPRSTYRPEDYVNSLNIETVLVNGRTTLTDKEKAEVAKAKDAVEKYATERYHELRETLTPEAEKAQNRFNNLSRVNISFTLEDGTLYSGHATPAARQRQIFSTIKDILCASSQLTSEEKEKIDEMTFADIYKKYKDSIDAALEQIKREKKAEQAGPAVV